MNDIEIRMPKITDDMEEGVIVKVLKSKGDSVKKDEPVAEIVVGKLSSEIESPENGVIKDILIEEGAIVAVDKVIAVVETGVTTSSKVHEDKEVNKEEVKKEVKTYLATPLAKKIAKENNIDIGLLKPASGNNRINEKDVLSYIEYLKNNQGSQEDYTELKLTAMRKAIGENMSRSAFTAPHVTLTTEAIVDKLDIIRNKIKLEEGIKVSYNDLILYFAAKALKKCPQINATFENNIIKRWSKVNLAMAIALDEGLIAAVIHNAESLDILSLSRKASDIVARAKNGKLNNEDLTNGTFTVTNLGMYGIRGFTPIINPPQAAILGVGEIVKKPVILEDAIAIRKTMVFSISFDHRAVDGSGAADYLKVLKQYIEKPEDIDELVKYFC